MNQGERRKARELMRRAAVQDHGGRGKSPGSRAALAANRPRSPVTLGPRCAGKNNRGQPCGQPAVNGASMCCYHGGREQAPTGSAARRWYLKTGQIIETMGQAKRQLRAQARTHPIEDHLVVGKHLPSRVAGGALAYWQALLMGLNALQSRRDGTDPMAWQRFILHSKTLTEARRRRY